MSTQIRCTCKKLTEAKVAYLKGILTLRNTRKIKELITSQRSLHLLTGIHAVAKLEPACNSYRGALSLVHYRQALDLKQLSFVRSCSCICVEWTEQCKHSLFSRKAWHARNSAGNALCSARRSHGLAQRYLRVPLCQLYTCTAE